MTHRHLQRQLRTIHTKNMNYKNNCNKNCWIHTKRTITLCFFRSAPMQLMIWYMIWYNTIYDMIRYDIWYDMDMIWYMIWYIEPQCYHYSCSVKFPILMELECVLKMNSYCLWWQRAFKHVWCGHLACR